ncbi:MAG: hypothetical protein ACRD1L_13190 [Terriglobales bacterium]
MIGTPLAKKLGIKPGMRALIVGAPPGFMQLLQPLPDGATVAATRTGLYPFLQFFARNRAQVAASVPALLHRAAPGALVWIAYPKTTSGLQSDLNRDLLAGDLLPTGWRPVAIVALDQTWSALRFRPIADVKSRRP